MAWRKPTNLNEWLGILVRHKKKFFFPVIITMITVIFLSQWLEREYKAVAKFQRKTEGSAEASQSNVGNLEYRKLRAMRMHNFRGRPAIIQLVKDLNLTEGPKFPRTADGELTRDGRLEYEQLLKEIQSEIIVRTEVDRAEVELISVSFSHPDRELAPKVVNQLVDNYVRTLRTTLTETIMKQKKFFDGEVERYRRKVGELERSKLRFSIDNPGLPLDNPGAAHDRLDALKKNREHNRKVIERQKHTVSELIKWEKEQPEFVIQRSPIDNPELVAIKEKLAALKQNLDIHQNEYRRTTAHPAVINTLDRIAKAEKELQEFVGEDEFEVEEVPNVEKIEAQKEIVQMAAELQTNEKLTEEDDAEIERLEVLNRNFFEVRNEYLTITRELKESTEQLKFWDDNLRKTTVALTADVSSRGMTLIPVQRAQDLARPSSPDLTKIIAGALFISLAVGVLFLVLAELLDQSYRSVEQAMDDIKLPVLGAVNEIVSPGVATRRKILGWGVFPAVTTVLCLALFLTFSVAKMSLNEPHKYDEMKEAGIVKFISDRIAKAF
jgi:uncharacterized protein involved in exopolysaccharide biosynthesis